MYNLKNKNVKLSTHLYLKIFFKKAQKNTEVDYSMQTKNTEPIYAVRKYFLY